MRRNSKAKLGALAGVVLAFSAFYRPALAQSTSNVTTLTGGDPGEGFDGSVPAVVAITFGAGGTQTVQNVNFEDWTQDPNASLGQNGYYNNQMITYGNSANDQAMQTIVSSGLYGLNSSPQGTNYYELQIGLTGLTSGDTYQAQFIMANSVVQPRDETVYINGTYEGEADMGQNSANDLYASFTATGNEQFILQGLAPAEGPPYYAPADGLISALVITSGPVSLIWNDASGNNLWDTSSNNWTGGSGNTTYSDGNLVTFNDNNNSNYTVTLNTTVSPGSVTVNNSAGNYSITGSGAIIDTGSFTKSGTGSLTLGTGLTAGSMSITGGTVKLATNTTSGSVSPSSNVNITSLTISGTGKLDIDNNHIIIDYGSSDPMSTIYGYLKSGYNNGGWNGPGIISSEIPIANVNLNNPQYGIGFSDGNDKISGHAIVSGLSSGQIELKYTLLGDANLDGTVNGADFSILAANFGQGYTNWDQGDFLYTSAVNGADFTALAHNFGQGDNRAAVAVSSADWAAVDAFAAANGLSATVPEPASIGLVAIGVLPLLRRRRR
jgi:hypothetical protein